MWNFSIMVTGRLCIWKQHTGDATPSFVQDKMVRPSQQSANTMFPSAVKVSCQCRITSKTVICCQCVCSIIFVHPYVNLFVTVIYISSVLFIILCVHVIHLHFILCVNAAVAAINIIHNFLNLILNSKRKVWKKGILVGLEPWTLPLKPNGLLIQLDAQTGITWQFGYIQRIPWFINPLITSNKSTASIIPRHSNYLFMY